MLILDSLRVKSKDLVKRINFLVSRVEVLTHFNMSRSSSNPTDTELKEQGNKLFNMRHYDQAVGLYTKAIIKNPVVPTYFTNRALCYLKMKRWEQTCQDCKRALDIDSNHVKGHFFLGSALLELESYDEAIKHLQRANDLAKEQKQNFGDDIASQIRLARKKRWNIQEEKRINQEIELLSYLNKLILDDSQRQIRKVETESCGKESEEDAQNKIMELELKCDNHISELTSLFAKVDDRRRKRDIPDYLCGKISFELLREPVITPSGITYDKKDIIEHLQKVGHFDPVTRVKLTSDQLIPNYAMKDVIDAFIQENEWALDY